MTNLPTTVRRQHGFERTRCACAYCQAPCRHIPGGLDIDDLARLCPAGQDLFVWAETHLRARIDKPYPVLVPARQANGHCHWHFDGRCAVHDDAPYGCAFFDAHMPEQEVTTRYQALEQARRQDAAERGIYSQLWEHLSRKSLIDVAKNSTGLIEDLHKINRETLRHRRRQLT
jgi:hypothetical protein